MGKLKIVSINGVQILKCQVHNCETRARFKNPDSGLRYCIPHFDKLGGRIIYETDPQTKHPTKWVQLVKLPGC